MKVLRAKKYAKMRKQQPEPVEKPQTAAQKKSSDCEAGKKPADADKDKEKDHQVYIILSCCFISFFDQFHFM